MKLFFIVAIFLTVPLFVFAHLGEHGDAEILMTSRGFEPREVTIKQGESILFRNEDTRGRWPASNIHPTHTLYPGSDIKKCGTSDEEHIFDSCRELAYGEEYKFVFTQPGEWRFHDHALSQYSGVITVEEVEGYVAPIPEPSQSEQSEVKTEEPQKHGFWMRVWIAIKNFFRGLFGSEEEGNIPEASINSQQSKGTSTQDIDRDLTKLQSDKNYELISITSLAKDDPELARALNQLGVERTMEKLVQESDGGSTVDCHQEAHYIGRLGYEIFKESVFKQCDPSCHSGCYHGAMERFLAEKGTKDLAKNIDEVCSVFATRFGIFECLHGVGHGVTAYLDYDIPEALRQCEELSSSFAASSCFGGVFMENIVTGQGLGAGDGPHATTWVNHADPHYPCNAISQDYTIQYQCYQMQTSWMLTIFNYDFSKVAAECLRAPYNMVSVCYKSYGRDAAGHTLRDPQKIKELCDLISDHDTYYADCVTGAENVIVDFWGPGLDAQASEFCNVLDQAYQESCYQLLAGRLVDVFHDQADIKRVCGTFSSQYKHLCLNLQVQQ